MRRLAGVPQRYAWGSVEEIPQLLGQPADGEPFAEYWVGAHPLGDASLESGEPLSKYLRDDPQLLGKASLEEFGGRLPFLIKLLSAGSPLSLQAHPSRTDAERGYAQESLRGVPVESPERSFKDDWPKPETLVALTPFDGLVGFRDPAQTLALFDALDIPADLEQVLAPLRDRAPVPALQEVFLDVLALENRHLVEELLAAAVAALEQPGEVGEFARTAVELDEHFPGDPSILAALLLNRIRLEPGEAVAFEAGVMHFYLRGTAVEITGNSDNVLRGGLTRKHIDVDGLLQVVHFDPSPPTIDVPAGGDGVYVYPTRFEEFELWMIQPVNTHVVDVPRDDSARIALVTAGEFELTSSSGDLVLRQGQAAFLGAGEQAGLQGQGQLFLASAGV